MGRSTAHFVFLVFSIANLTLPIHARNLPALPEPVANNAVAKVKKSGDTWLISFMGLTGAKTWQEVHNKVWALKIGEQQWHTKSPVPSSLPLAGRLASIAVGVGEHAYLFGGYTVAEDHTEISSPDNLKYDVVSDTYQKIAAMPVPVDDAVALVYQNRYIYLVSGWHNDGNVNLTQVYDTLNDSWQQASPFLGRPVFGQAGGIVGNQLLICDGVGVEARPDKRRTFAAEAACYSGTIAADNHLRIDWRVVAHPTGGARYRMAATGLHLQSNKGVLFIGGSENPYNYNAIGYNGSPSVPDKHIWFYDFEQQHWQVITNDTPTMDHRGLLQVDDTVHTVGGMDHEQRVLAKITSYNLNNLFPMSK